MANSMEPYRRDGRAGWYVDLGYVKLPDGSRRRFRGQRCEGRTRMQAREWAQRERARLALQGPHTDPRKEIPTLDGFLDLYLQECSNRAGRSWIERQRSAYRTWAGPHLGRTKVADVTARRIDGLVRAMREAGRQPRTIRNTLDVVRGMLRLAKRYSLISAVPEFPNIRLNRTKPEPHSFADVRHLLRKASEWPDPASLPVLALGVHGGLRAGEIMGLHWSDVDFDRGILHVRRAVTATGEVKPPKTESGTRTIPLTPTLLEALREWRKGATVGVPWLFHDRGEPITHKWLKVRVLPVLRRSKLGQTQPLQRLRHTFNTEAKAREIPYDQILRWMGHEARADDVNGSHYTGAFDLDVQRDWIARLESEPPALARLRAKRGSHLGASGDSREVGVAAATD